MKLKKIISGAVASTIAMSILTAIPTSAATTIPDHTYVGWWSYHTDGIELSADKKVTITFHDVSNGVNNWDNGLLVFYNADENKVGSTNYDEVGVYRVDNYGWAVGNGDTGENYAVYTAAGYTWESRSTVDWGAFLTQTQSGIDVTAEVTNTSVTLTTSNGIDYTATFPRTADYLSLTAQDATLSNISYEVRDIVKLEDGKRVYWKSATVDGKYNYRAAYVCKKSELDGKKGLEFTFNTTGNTVSGTATKYYTGVADSSTQTYTMASDDLVIITYVLRNIPSTVDVTGFSVDFEK